MPKRSGMRAAAAAIAGIAIATAAPAWADGSLNGTYDLAWNDGDQSTWVVTSTCTNPNSCVAHIVSDSPDDLSRWEGDAQMANGRWTMVIDKAEGALCRDGSRAPTRNAYSWDGSTLSGTLVVNAGAICGETVPASSTYTFTMSKVG